MAASLFLTTVWALHNFTPTEADEIAFSMSEPIFVLHKDDGYSDGWWTGQNARGDVGLFPANFTRETHVEALSSLEEPPRAVSLLLEDVSDFPPDNYARNAIPSTYYLYETCRITTTLPELVKDWTTDDVVSWLNTIEFSEYADGFRENDITGAELVSEFLDVNALKELGIVKLERRIKLMHHLVTLRDSNPVSQAIDICTTPTLSLHHKISIANIPEKSLARKKRRKTVKVTTKISADIRTLSDVVKSCSGFVGKRADYEGYLYKRGGSAYWSWKKRYFFLKDMTLWYFKTASMNAKPLGIICLPSYRIGPATDCSFAKEWFTFTASHESARTYCFRADSMDSMTGWMNAMSSASLGMTSSRPPAISVELSRLNNVPRKLPVSPVPSEEFDSDSDDLEALTIVTSVSHNSNTMQSSSLSKESPPPVPEKPAELRKFQLSNPIVLKQPAQSIKKSDDNKVSDQDCTKPFTEESQHHAEVMRKVTKFGSNPLTGKAGSFSVHGSRPVPTAPSAVHDNRKRFSSLSVIFDQLDVSNTTRKKPCLRSDIEYVLWINNVLFASDSIPVVLQSSQASIKQIKEYGDVEISSPPDDVVPIDSLHLDLTDGITLLEFLLRILSRKIIEEALLEILSSFGFDFCRNSITQQDIEMLKSNCDWELWCEGMTKVCDDFFSHYRSLCVSSPRSYANRSDNLGVVWLLLTNESAPSIYQRWKKETSFVEENEDQSVYNEWMRSLRRITPQDVHEGNLEMICQLMQLIEEVTSSNFSLLCDDA